MAAADAHGGPTGEYQRLPLQCSGRAHAMPRHATPRHAVPAMPRGGGGSGSPSGSPTVGTVSVERLRRTDESSAAALCAQALSAIGAIGGSSKAALSVGLVTSIGVGSVSTYMSTVRTDLTTVHSRGRGRAAQLWPY